MTAYFGYKVFCASVDNGNQLDVASTPKYAIWNGSKNAPAAVSDEDTDTQTEVEAETNDIEISDAQTEVVVAGKQLYVNVKANTEGASNEQNHIATVYLRDSDEHITEEYAISASPTESSPLTTDTAITEISIPITVNNAYAINAVYWTSYTTGVEDVAVEANSKDGEYFNLNGLRIKSENLTPGIYIRRTTTKAEKVIIK